MVEDSARGQLSMGYHSDRSIPFTHKNIHRPCVNTHTHNPANPIRLSGILPWKVLWRGKYVVLRIAKVALYLILTHRFHLALCRPMHTWVTFCAVKEIGSKAHMCYKCYIWNLRECNNWCFVWILIRKLKEVCRLNHGWACFPTLFSFK